MVVSRKPAPMTMTIVIQHPFPGAATVIASALAFCVAGPGLAADFAATPEAYVARMDLDNDGRVALAEFRDYMSRGFRSRDRDGNGVLEGEELPDISARPVRLAEHLDRLADAFARQDRNGDGWLDARELASPPR